MIVAASSEISWTRVASAALAFGLQHALWRRFLQSKRGESRRFFTEILDALFIPASDEAANRLVSLTHAVVSIILGTLCLTVELRPCGMPLGPIQRTAMQVALGYFIYDLSFEIWKAKAYDMILHHVFACVGLTCGLLTNRSGTEIMGSIVFSELSTPFLHLRFFLSSYRSNPVGRRYFDMVSGMFAVTFLTLRCLTAGPLITYLTLKSPTAPLLVKVGGLILYLVSLQWGFMLVRVAIRKFALVSSCENKDD